MSTACEIEINFENNPKKICFSGQKLNLTVRLKLTEDVEIRTVYIHLRGKAHVHIGEVTVLDMGKCLVDGNGEAQVLPIGTHDYSFACTLPSDLPSSFFGIDGWYHLYVKYSAVVDLTFSSQPDTKLEEKFTIFKPVDLNDYPYSRGEASEQKTQLVCFADQPGIIKIFARIPTGGYTHGQRINVQVSVRNETTFCPIDHFVIYIIRHTITESKIKLDIMKKWSMIEWKCKPHRRKTFPSEYIEVPAMIPPTDETSKIIKIKYLVSIRAMFGNQYGSSGLDLPIIIGTKPFDDSIPATINRLETGAPTIAAPHDVWPFPPRLMEPSATAFPDDDTVSIRTYASTPPPFPDDDFDLPTYEDALLMDEEIDINLAQMYIESMEK